MKSLKKPPATGSLCIENYHPDFVGLANGARTTLAGDGSAGADKMKTTTVVAAQGKPRNTPNTRTEFRFLFSS
jgi:hypothetical protein